MDVDVVVIGGGLAGSLASVMLARRGLKTVVLESRAAGKEQKVVVGEALTEGTSVFLRHEIGMTDWLKENAFRISASTSSRSRARARLRRPPRIATSSSSRSRRSRRCPEPSRTSSRPTTSSAPR